MVNTAAQALHSRLYCQHSGRPATSLFQQGFRWSQVVQDYLRGEAFLAQTPREGRWQKWHSGDGLIGLS